MTPMTAERLATLDDLASVGFFKEEVPGEFALELLAEVKRLQEEVLGLNIALDMCVDKGSYDMLAEKLAEWEKLRDPAVLHLNILRGTELRLTKEHLLHLLGDQAPTTPPTDDARVELAREITRRRLKFADLPFGEFEALSDAEHEMIARALSPAHEEK